MVCRLMASVVSLLFTLALIRSFVYPNGAERPAYTEEANIVAGGVKSVVWRSDVERKGSNWANQYVNM